ncbi:MAG TPA: hypothetical protein VN810_01385 [Terriglobales bacterium]|nr:hypothetical protein [Terriglobales bacterium]
MPDPTPIVADAPAALSEPSIVSSVLVRPQATLRRWAVLLFLSLNFLFMLTSTGRVRLQDELMTLFESESLVLRGSTAVPQAVAANLFFGRYDRQGQPRAAYAPGQALVTTPWYALGHYVLRPAPGVPSSARDLVVGFAMTMSSAAFAAAAATFAFLLFCGMGIERRTALAATLVLALATPLFAYSGWFFSEPLACALFLGAAWSLFGRSDCITARRAALGAALLGFAVLVRPTHILLAPIFLVAILVREGRGGFKPAMVAAVVFSVAVAAYLGYNYHVFGNPFQFGYPDSVEAGKHVTGFETPLRVGLLGFLVSPGKSIFLFGPPVLLALWGLPALWRRDRGPATIATMSLPLALGFYARYTQWEGGYCFGPRYLVPALVLLALALGPALAEAGQSARAVAIVLFIAGVAVQMLGIATSFLEAEVGHGYYNARFDYRLGYNALGMQAELLLKYLGSHEPAAIGHGFDRWFVFLSKGGVSHGTLLAFAMVMACGAAFSIVALVGCLRREGTPLPASSSSAS